MPWCILPSDQPDFSSENHKAILDTEIGPVESHEACCLKPKVGSGTLLEDTTEHLPGITIFDIKYIIYGPLAAVPVRVRKFDVPKYEDVLEHFNIVKKLNRNLIE